MASIVAPLGQVLPGSEIKGTMILQQVSEQCGVPLDVLYRELKKIPYRFQREALHPAVYDVWREWLAVAASGVLRSQEPLKQSLRTCSRVGVRRFANGR